MKKKKNLKKIKLEEKQRNLNNDLTEEQKKELEKLADEVLEEAKLMVNDYAKNPSELSGSMIQVHQDSPFLEKKEKN
tara:strand:+ start:812 stop:1042 length:231 start_codon:yes stop_codon:yes gene_type:complete